MSTTNLDVLHANTIALGGFVPWAASLKSAQALTGDGAITIKQGAVTLDKAGAIAASLANPTNVTDDFKLLVITSLTAQAHTVLSDTPFFGGGGVGAAKATFGAAIGNSLTLLAFGGKWWVINAFGVTLGVA